MEVLGISCKMMGSQGRFYCEKIGNDVGVCKGLKDNSGRNIGFKEMLRMCSIECLLFRSKASLCFFMDFLISSSCRLLFTAAFKVIISIKSVRKKDYY